MATRKTTKSSTTRKKPAVKKATAKRTQNKELQSFKVVKQQTPFMTTKFSRQSVYWIVLGIVIIGFSIWILKLQSDIQSIYDSISTDNNAVIDTPIKKHTKK